LQAERSRVTDIFEEVEEQLRSENVQQLLRKIWPWALGVAVAALLIALGVWGFDTLRKREAARTSEAYAAALDTFRKGDVDKAYVAFGQAAKTSSKGYEALALMQQGGIRLQQGKTEEAVALFDKAASAAPGPIIGDMARLKSALALLDTAPYPAIEERLKTLTDAKRPYHVVAREALAMAKVRAGRLQEARSDFQVLQVTPDAPEAVRQRAQIAVNAIDSGAAQQVPAAVAAALKAPPPPPSLSSLLPQAGAAQ